MPSSFQLNPAAQVTLRHIGREGCPLLVIDDFLLDPEDLVDAAAAGPWSPADNANYPGPNADLPGVYVELMLAALSRSFTRAFQFPADTRFALRGFFGLTTRGLEDLGP